MRWCRGETAELDILSGLKLPVVVDVSADSEEARGVERDTFPDPTAADVFWIQDIVRATPDHVLVFVPYF